MPQMFPPTKRSACALACAVRTSAWHRSRVAAGAHIGGDAAAPNLTLRMAGTGDLPLLYHSIHSIAASVCLTTYLPLNTNPARRLLQVQVPPLCSACVRRYVYHHCFWECGLESNHHHHHHYHLPGSVEQPWDMVSPYHREQLVHKDTWSLPHCPCDDRSLLTLAPALWKRRRLVQR